MKPYQTLTKEEFTICKAKRESDGMNSKVAKAEIPLEIWADLTLLKHFSEAKAVKVALAMHSLEAKVEATMEASISTNKDLEVVKNTKRFPNCLKILM